MQEMSVRDVKGGEVVDLDQVVRDFLTIASRERAGELRLPEAALQNRLLRGLVNGSIAPDALSKRFARAFGAAAAERGLPMLPDFRFQQGKLVKKEIKPVEYADIFARGALAVFADVKRLQDGFENDRRQARLPATFRQMLGTHDRLDAEQGIDLVEVIYDIAKKKDAVQVVRFIQSKSAAVSERDAAFIRSIHQRYADKLATAQEALPAHGERLAKASVREGRWIERETARTNADRELFLQDYFTPLVFAIGSEPDREWTDETAEARLREYAQKILPAPGILKMIGRRDLETGLFVRDSLVASALGVAGTPEFLKAVERYKRWAQTPLTHGQMLEVVGQEAEDTLLRVPALSSVILHGSQRLEAPLVIQGGQAVLTA